MSEAIDLVDGQTAAWRVVGWSTSAKQSGQRACASTATVPAERPNRSVVRWRQDALPRV